MSNGTQSLNFTGMRDVRSSTQINQVATTVNRGATAIGHFGLQNIAFEGIVGKQLKPFFLCNDEAFEFLFLFDDFVDLHFDGFDYVRMCVRV